jgi:hypothetical protein
MNYIILRSASLSAFGKRLKNHSLGGFEKASNKILAK